MSYVYWFNFTYSSMFYWYAHAMTEIQKNEYRVKHRKHLAYMLRTGSIMNDEEWIKMMREDYEVPYKRWQAERNRVYLMIALGIIGVLTVSMGIFQLLHLH